MAQEAQPSRNRLQEEVARAAGKVLSTLADSGIVTEDVCVERVVTQILDEADLRLVTQAGLVKRVVETEGISRASAYRRVDELPADLEIPTDIVNGGSESNASVFLQRDTERILDISGETKKEILDRLWAEHVSGLITSPDI